MASQHYRSPFGDTTYTKVFVGGLAWETHTDVMRRYFEQFGEILEAVIITDKNTTKSKGYGFVTFRDPDSARRACVEPNPVIDGRRANCNIASLGRPRPSPPRGRNQGVIYQGGVIIPQGASPSHSGVAGSLPPLPPPPPMIYPPYGYATYSPEYGYQQAIYNPGQLQQAQYYQNIYGNSSTTSPYYYGYSMAASRGGGGGTFHHPQATQQRFPGPSYLYYPTPQMEAASAAATSFTYPPSPQPLLPQPRLTFPSSTPDAQTPQQSSETEVEPAGGATSETPNT